MAVLRSLWLALLVVALLPWGAHLSVRATPAGPAAPVALQDIAAHAVQKRAAPAPRRCRTAVLCATDLAVLPAVVRAAAPGSRGPAPDTGGTFARGNIPETLIPPPKPT